MGRRNSDKNRIKALQDACERACWVGESVPPKESFKAFLESVRSIVGDDIAPAISFVEDPGTSNPTIEENRAWTHLFGGSERDRHLYTDLFHTSTRERVVLALTRRHSRPESGPMTSFEASVHFNMGSHLAPIVFRAKWSDYGKFMDEMFDRPVLSSGLTRKQQEMASSLVRTRLAHSFTVIGSTDTMDYGLTLPGKAARIAIKWRWLTVPLAFGFSALVLFSNLNATIELAYKLRDCWQSWLAASTRPRSAVPQRLVAGARGSEVVERRGRTVGRDFLSGLVRSRELAGDASENAFMVGGGGRLERQATGSVA